MQLRVRRAGDTAPTVSLRWLPPIALKLNVGDLLPTVRQVPDRKT